MTIEELNGLIGEVRRARGLEAVLEKESEIGTRGEFFTVECRYGISSRQAKCEFRQVSMGKDDYLKSMLASLRRWIAKANERIDAAQKALEGA